LDRINKLLLPVRLSNVVAGGRRHGRVLFLDSRQPELGQRDRRVGKLVFQDNMTVRLVLALLTTLDPTVDSVVRGLVCDRAWAWGDLIAVNVPVIGISVPDDGAHTHLPSNGTNAIIDITIGWAPAFRGDTENLLDHSQGVVELGNDLSVGQGGHGGMRPSVRTNRVAVVKTTLSSCRRTNDLGTDIEQVGLLVVVLKQVIIKVGFGPLGVFGSDRPVVHGTIVIS